MADFLRITSARGLRGFESSRRSIGTPPGGNTEGLLLLIIISMRMISRGNYYHPRSAVRGKMKWRID